MTLSNELKQTVKKLRLSGILPTLLERMAYAKQQHLTYGEFFELVMQDEVDRRLHNQVDNQMKKAGINPFETLERYDFDAPVQVDREMIKGLFSLNFIEEKDNVMLCGPVGVGKTYLANALAHAAVRRGKKVLMVRAEKLFKKLQQSRADFSYEKALLGFITPDMLIIDDFGLKALNEQQSTDFYEIVVERYGRASTVITSNRDTDEWLELFHDPILANSALDRLVHNAYRVVIEGESYRKIKSRKKLI
jgi:DNA replication protein DnaC